MRLNPVHLLVVVVILALAWYLLPAVVALIITAIALLSFLGYF